LTNVWYIENLYVLLHRETSMTACETDFSDIKVAFIPLTKIKGLSLSCIRHCLIGISVFGKRFFQSQNFRLRFYQWQPCGMKPKQAREIKCLFVILDAMFVGN
jgi:hypothetical protein